MNKTGRVLARGSYNELHYLYSCGHNGYFADKDGNWWATIFSNNNDPLMNQTNGFNNGFALVPIDFLEADGRVVVDSDRLLAFISLDQSATSKRIQI